jgi:hypothetical protein
MTDDQKSHLIEAMMHLEIAGECNGGLETGERIDAALYLVQFVVNGHKPPNWQEVLDAVRAVDAQNVLLDIQERSKRRHG